jgi:sporulation protein YlmC with PRC-barrel domain
VSRGLVALERYVGKPVLDADGRSLGRLHEVRVREDGGELVVLDYLVGRAGLLERFSLTELAREIGFLFGLERAEGYVVPWDCMQFPSDGKPRCLRRAAELERLSAARREER